MSKLAINLSWLPLKPSSWTVDWAKFFNLNYLTVPNAGSSFRYYSQFIILFDLLLIGSLVIFFWKRKFRVSNPPKYNYLKKVTTYLLSFGLSGLFLIFLRFENAKLLSSRIVFLITLVSFLVWGGRLINEYLHKLPEEEKIYQNILLKQKYLPKKKHRK